MAQDFHRLRIADKIQETPDAVSLVFNLNDELLEKFRFKSGQYITIQASIDGEELRRSYSICAAPQEGILKVNVKRVQGGRMSTYIVEQLHAGAEVEVGVPEGKFVMSFDPSKRRNHYFIAAGSGITPVLSLLKDGLESEPLSTFVLLYGNKSKDSIIFREEIVTMQKKFGEQLRVFHTLSQQNTGSKLFGLFGNKNKDWDGWLGRIDSKKLNQLIEEIPLNNIENHFYLCGPGELISSCQNYISSIESDGIHLHKEYFANPDQKIGPVLAARQAKLTYKNLHGVDGEITVPKGKTILDTLMDEGADPPYSCMNGVCSSCVAKLVKGQVEMETCLALEEDEIKAGYILTCQSQCLTPEVEIEYEA